MGPANKLETRARPSSRDSNSSDGDKEDIIYTIMLKCNEWLTGSYKEYKEIISIVTSCPYNLQRVSVSASGTAEARPKKALDSDGSCF